MNELTRLMDDVYRIVKEKSVEDAVEVILRRVSGAEVPTALEALARLLVIAHARSKHAEA